MLSLYFFSFQQNKRAKAQLLSALHYWVYDQPPPWELSGTPWCYKNTNRQAPAIPSCYNTFSCWIILLILQDPMEVIFFLKQATFYVSTVSCLYLTNELSLFLLMSSLSILSGPCLSCYCHYKEQLSTQHVEIHEINPNTIHRINYEQTYNSIFLWFKWQKVAFEKEGKQMAENNWWMSKRQLIAVYLITH